jgi:hypothetical protein
MGAGGSEMGFLRGAWLHAIVMRRRGSALVVGPRPLRDAPSSARSYLTLEPRWRPHAAGLFFQWPPPRMAASRTMAGMAKTNHSSFKATPSRASPFRRPWTGVGEPLTESSTIEKGPALI